MKKLLISGIKVYQRTPTRIHNSCRHIPTCSNYAIEAIEKYGAIKGSIKAGKRILRCNPISTRGYTFDPVEKE